MQVFKSYFKILNRHMGQMIMYLSIFIGIMVVLTATCTNKAEGDYEAASPNLPIFDYDKFIRKQSSDQNILKDMHQKKY